MRNCFDRMYNGLCGIKYGFTEERTLKALFLIPIIILIFSSLLTSLEIVLCVVMFGFLYACEIFNTCIERILDFLHGKEYNREVKIIKDMAAGAVSIAFIVNVVLLLYFILT